MTLFEAIRALKEGQAIAKGYYGNGKVLVHWKYGELKPTAELLATELLNAEVAIINKPRPTLEEGLRMALHALNPNNECAKCVWSELDCLVKTLENPKCLIGGSEAVAKILRSLPIDWQAEADRQKEEK